MGVGCEVVSARAEFLLRHAAGVQSPYGFASSKGRRLRRRFTLPDQSTKSRLPLFAGLVALAVVGGALLMAWERQQSRLEAERAVEAAAAARAERLGLPQLAQIRRALEAMQLLTVVLETQVSSTSKDESWRGDVTATVRSRARLLYGVDLSTATVERESMGPLEKLILTVPPPRRMASELVDTPAGDPAATPEVALGWLRFRTRAGEYQVGEARRMLPAAVAAMTLSPRDAEMVRDQSADRLKQMVRLFVGPEVFVEVRFVER
jgi:hypothetical protein